VQRPVERLVVENGVAVSPNRDRPTAGQHSLRFGEERAMVEPMESLRCGDEIDRLGGKAARLRARHSVLDPLVGSGAADLLLAGVGCDHALEMFCESNRGLSVAGAAIERDPVLARQSGQDCEQGFRI
jgi:hypothetical protein